MKKKQAANANLPGGSFELDEETLEQVTGGAPQDTGLIDRRTYEHVYQDGSKYYELTQDGLHGVEKKKIQWLPG